MVDASLNVLSVRNIHKMHRAKKHAGNALRSRLFITKYLVMYRRPNRRAAGRHPDRRIGRQAGRHAGRPARRYRQAGWQGCGGMQQRDSRSANAATDIQTMCIL
jgi:hypothetical protein